MYWRWSLILRRRRASNEERRLHIDVAETDKASKRHPLNYASVGIREKLGTNEAGHDKFLTFTLCWQPLVQESEGKRMETKYRPCANGICAMPGLHPLIAAMGRSEDTKQNTLEASGVETRNFV